MTAICNALECNEDLEGLETLVEDTNPLCLAASQGDIRSIQKLLNSGTIDINAPDSQGNTALHFAAQQGDLQIAKTLLKTQGVNINAQDSKDNTALHLAAVMGNLEAVKLLIKHGADTAAQNNAGKYPSGKAFEGNNTFDVVAYLCSKGAPFTPLDKKVYLSLEDDTSSEEDTISETTGTSDSEIGCLGNDGMEE